MLTEVRDLSFGSSLNLHTVTAMGASRAGGHKNIGFPRNTGPDPLKNHKATKPAFNVGPSSDASKAPLQWRFAGGPLMGQLKRYLDPLSSHQRNKNYQI